MNKQVRILYLLLITFIFSVCNLSAQTTFGSEEELKAQAAKLFDNDEFEEAYPLYSQLTSIYPKDANYNYRIGVCMLYASDDKEKPIPFLEFAANKPDVEKEVFFYLARAYHLNYRFDEAIKQYQAFQKVASAAKAEKLMVDRQIEMCKNGKKLLRNLTDLVVIDKKEMSRTDFFRSYDISEIGGKLLVKPDEEVFKSALDKKKKEKSIIYLASNNNQVFFSSYGDDAEQGKDIYIIRKLPNGEWSKPQTLGYPVNTEYDEDYPFLHPNGKVLYFCSKGHNSMGGFDIFKTTLNEETNTWNKPVNLDFPINTPDDDILYVTNEDEKEAFFSSARASKTGKTAVYHINVERKPIDIAIIKGAVVKNRDNQPLDVKITVKDMNDNVILGIFNSKASNGVYLINIPNGGKFLFTVEATGFLTQSEVVDVPVQYVFRPMKQEISYELGTDKLIIKNLFDEVLDDASYLLALNFIKEKSKMDVNVNDAGQSNNSAAKDTSASTDAATAIKTTDNTSKTNPAANLSNEDIVKIGYADAADVEKEAKDLKEQADIALVLANQKNELAINKAKEAAQLMSDASRMDDNVKKQATIDEANEAFQEAEELNQETVAAFNLAKKIEFRASAKEQEADLSMQYAKDLEAAVKSKTTDASLFARLEDQQKKLDVLAEQNNNPTLANSLKMDVDNKKRELDKAIQTTEEIKQEIADNEALIITTQADADKEKNANVKQGLLDQVTGLRMDTEDSKKDLVLNEQKVAKLQKEYNGVVNETTLVSNVYDQAKSLTNEKAAADVAMIDKAKLEQKVNEIKKTPVTTDNAVATNSVVKDNTTKTTDNTVADNSAKTTDNTTKTTDNSIADNAAKTTDNASKTNDASANNASKTSDNAAIADNAVKDNSVEAKADQAKKFNDELAAADNITNELERETKKADLYSQWTASVNEDLAAKKAEVKKEKNKEKKKALNSEIASLEKELKEKQKATATTLANVETLKKKENVLADNSSTETESVSSTPVNVNRKYAAEVAATESITNEADRETAKAAALQNWSKAIDADVIRKKRDMDASTDPEMKALLAVKIKEGEQLSKEKQMEAEQSLAKAKKLKDPAIADNIVKTTDNTAKTTDNTLVDNTTKTTDNSVKAVDNTTKTSDNTIADNAAKTSDDATSDSTSKTTDNKAVSDNNESNDAAVEKQFVYTSSSANEQAVKATVLNKEAEDLSSRSTELKSKAAAEKNTTTKNALYAEAEELSKRSEDKTIESAKIIAAANKTEFLNGQNKLEQFAVNTKGNMADDISMAEMMKDEAAIYFNKAQKSREMADNSTVFYEKETAMEDAYKNEMIALEKQKKANEIYRRYTPDVAVNDDLILADNATKSSDNTIKTTDDAVADNTTKTADNTTKTTDDTVADNATKTADNTTKTTDDTVADNATKTADNTAKTNDDVVADNATKTADNATKTTDDTVADNATKTTDDNAVSDNAIKKNVESEVFVSASAPVYSAAKPIPVNEKLPEGLIFKVQIGAFRKPIPQDLFKGMSPITGETTTQGFTRYTAGLFTKYTTADKVKEEIRALGYKDAFVVAFLNGKRISISEAAAMIGESIAAGDSKTNAPVVDNTTKNNIVPDNTAKTSDQISAPAITQNITDVNGLFYTVQVGVYSQPVASSKLFNIQPLYIERAPNGNLRYNTGIYNDINRALEAKNIAVNAGIKDAFVTAYYNGKRVSVPEAQQLSAQGNVFSTSPDLNVLPTFSSSTARPKSTPAVTPDQVINVTPPANNIDPKSTEVAVTNPVVSDEIKAAASNPMPIDSGVVYKVQIGAFKDEVPLEIANKFLRIAKKGIKNYKDANGLTIYTVGTYRTYEEADQSRKEVVNEGEIKDAFIVAYKDGIKISVEEAKVLTGK